MKLTKLTIEALKFSGKSQVYWDDELPGFGVRVFASGKKSFVLKYRHKGTQHIMTVGRFGEITPVQARELARDAAYKIRRGEDVLATKKREAAADTFSDLLDAYLTRHAMRKKSYRDDKRRVEKYLRPVMGSRKATDIDRKAVANLHGKIGKEAPYEANRVLALVSRIFELGQVWLIVPEGFPNPAKRIVKFKEMKRDRYIKREQMPRVMEAIDSLGNPYIRAAIWIYLLTGLRKNELLALKWTDIDFKEAELRIADTKASRPHYLPLSKPALAILGHLEKVKDNPFVFPGKIEGQHLVEIKRAWGEVVESAKLGDMRLHDLRRTVGSWMAQRGESLNLIGKVLNHSNLSTTQVYARFSQEPIREALEEHGQDLLKVTNKSLRKLRAM